MYYGNISENILENQVHVGILIELDSLCTIDFDTISIF